MTCPNFLFAFPSKISEIFTKHKARFKKASKTLILAMSVFFMPFAASLAQADPIDDLDAKLSAQEPGATITLPTGDIDLAGRRIDVGAPDATLEGSPGSVDFQKEISSFGENFLADPLALELTREAAERRFEELIQKLLGGAPKTRILNSQAKAVTSEEASRGLHSGLAAPKGGFSLKNLSLSGTSVKAVRADASTGASHVYMGLVGPDLSRLARSDGNYPGLGDIDAVAFIENTVEADSNVNVEGNTIFFTQRRYGPAGEFDVKKPINALTPLNSISSSFFHENKTVVSPPIAEGDTGNRTYSGAGLGWARVGLIDASLFSRNSSSGGHHGFGGAIFADKIDKLSRSIFIGNSIAADHDAYGGAVNAKIGLLLGCVLVGNEAKGIAQPLVPGTAVAGGALSGSALVLEGSLFSWNKAVSVVPKEAEEREAFGGAVSSNQTLLVSKSHFAHNSAQVSAPDGLALGGALFVNASTDGSNPRAPRLNFTEIRNSSFVSNSVSALDGQASGGALAVLLSGADSYHLVLSADYGNSTIFQGNKAGDADSGLALVGGAAGGATVVIRAEAGGLVGLYDPLSAELTEGGDFALVKEGPGTFAWGGENIIEVAAGSKAKVDLGKNGLVVLTESFSLAPAEGSPSITVALAGAEIRLEIGESRKAPLFFRCDFSSFEGDFSAKFTRDNLTEASFILASESTGLKAFSSSWTDPEDGSSYSLAVAATGEATLQRTKPIAQIKMN